MQTTTGAQGALTPAGLGGQALRDRREALVRAHVDAENRHDVEGVIATFHHPCYDVVPLGELNDGAPAVHDFLAGVIGGFSDFAVQIPTYHHAERAVIVEGNFTGTHDGPWGGLPPSGRRIDVRFSAVFDFEEDRLICERLYFDLATMMRQLGAG
jgi:steroid delta-isomerase-like uncharacterized protein